MVIPADSSASVTFSWDGGAVTLARRQVLDVPPGRIWRPLSAVPTWCR
jgi:hypothetical protein